MEWKDIEKNWSEYKLNARRRWSRLTPGDLDATAGKREPLLGKIREAYGIPDVEAERQLAAWLAALRDVNPLR